MRNAVLDGRRTKRALRRPVRVRSIKHREQLIAALFASLCISSHCCATLRIPFSLDHRLKHSESEVLIKNLALLFRSPAGSRLSFERQWQVVLVNSVSLPFGVRLCEFGFRTISVWPEEAACSSAAEQDCW